MPERQPLTILVAIEAFTDALEAFPPLQAALVRRFMRWIAVNAAPLPYDFAECCHIARATTNEDRAAVAALTGLTPLSRVTVTGDGSVTRYGENERYGNAIQGGAFEGSPDLGLTLRKDRDWGIDPLGAAEQKAKERQQIRDRVRRHREKAGNALRGEEGNELLGCARNSEEIQNEEKERALLLPSVVVAHAVRAREGVPAYVREAEGGEAATPERRGAALKAMRACGITGVNGLHPDFLALLASGITDEELRWGAEDAVAKGKGFPYAVAALLGARQDAAAGTPSPMPSARPLSAWEQRARELAGPLAVGYKPPT